MEQFDKNLLIFVSISLLIFGIFFNWFTAYCQRRGWSEGYTWLFVVIGVGFTLVAAVPFVGFQNVLVMLWLFAASGFPMAAGDIVRFWRNREIEQGTVE